MEASVVPFLGEFGSKWMGFTGLDGLYAPFTRKTHLFVQKVNYVGILLCSD